MSKLVLMKVEERFQINGRGLVLRPNFLLLEEFKNFSSNVIVQNDKGNEMSFQASFSASHFNILDSANIDDRWRVEITLIDANKNEISIGDIILVSHVAYFKVTGKNT